jgi:hypothetical protein
MLLNKKKTNNEKVYSGHKNVPSNLRDHMSRMPAILLALIFRHGRIQ